MRILRKSPYILLEVMIALALVSMCVFPLITTQLYMYKSQKSLLQKMQRDRTSNLILAHIQTKLYENEISWDMLQEEQPYELPAEKILELAEKPFPYKVTYTITPTKWKNNPAKVRAKTGKNKDRTFHLFDLIITLQPSYNKKEKHSSTYLVFIEKRLTEGTKLSTDKPLDDDEIEEANQQEEEAT